MCTTGYQTCSTQLCREAGEQKGSISGDSVENNMLHLLEFTIGVCGALTLFSSWKEVNQQQLALYVVSKQLFEH